MTDRELLELAAKAAGMKPRDQWAYDDEWGIKVSDGPPPYEWWCPLTDDGDALRLAVKLNLHMGLEDNVANVWKGGMFHWSTEKHNDNPEAATRRAIVRAAAYIGKAMP